MNWGTLQNTLSSHGKLLLFWSLTAVGSSAPRGCKNLCVTPCYCRTNDTIVCEETPRNLDVSKLKQCGFTKLVLNASAPIVVDWKEVADLKNRSRRLNVLDVSQARLQCDCRNLWLDPQTKFQPVSGRIVCVGKYKSLCRTQNSTRPHSVKDWFGLPKSVVYGDKSACFDTSGEKRNFHRFLNGNCKKSLSTIETAVSTRTAMESFVSCEIDGPDCLQAKFRYAFPILKNSSGFKPELDDPRCPKKAVFNLNQTLAFNYSGSGMALCKQTGLIPSAAFFFVLFEGKPRIFGLQSWTQPERRSLKIDANPPSHSTRWYYYMRKNRAEYRWEIVPNATQNFRVHKVTEPGVSGVRSTFQISFRNPETSCTGGRYSVKSCNRYGCAWRRFKVHGSAIAVSCAEPNSTFRVVQIVVTKNGSNRNPSRNPWFTKTSTEPDDFSKTKTFIVLMTGGCVLAFGLVVVLILFVLRRRHRQKTPRSTSLGLTYWSHTSGENAACPLLPNTNYALIKGDSGCRHIPNPGITIICSLGEGAFGRVFLVECEDKNQRNAPMVRLAMKELKFVTDEKLKGLVREANVLTKLHHPNIVKFHGVIVKDNSLALLLEFMELGDLVTFLRDRNPDLVDMEKNGVAPLNQKDLLWISVQVAAGLEYLADNHFVHRDIAARNCLVNKAGAIKLGDFGMTRYITFTDYYKIDNQALVPLRWLPPESILYRKFTLECDIWSFGVLLWEVFSYGQVPWCQFSNCEVLEIVKEGRILSKPDKCPEEVYFLAILHCLKVKPNERLTATELKRVLETMLEQNAGYCTMDADVVSWDKTVSSAAQKSPFQKQIVKNESQRSLWKIEL